jgi:RimJ/RimL family protein N-acetyltransferase
MYNLRKVTEGDISVLFEWANDSEERANSKNNELITWDDHVSWFALKAKNDFNYMYILSAAKNDIGYIRFDENPEGLVISYFIDKNYRGKGLGKLMLKEGIAIISKIIKNPVFIAYVKEGNLVSEKIFKQFDFSIKRQELFKDTKFNIFQKI